MTDDELRQEGIEAAMLLTNEPTNRFWHGMGYLLGYRIAERAAVDASTLEREARQAIGVACELFCPVCGMQHIDAPETETGWENPPHRTHRCKFCSHEWRPYEVATYGDRLTGSWASRHNQIRYSSTAVTGLCPPLL